MKFSQLGYTFVCKKYQILNRRNMIPLSHKIKYEHFLLVATCVLRNMLRVVEKFMYRRLRELKLQNVALIYLQSMGMSGQLLYP